MADAAKGGPVGPPFALWPAAPQIAKRMSLYSRYLKAMQSSRRQLPANSVAPLVLALATLVACCAVAPSASATPAFYDGNSADGSIAVFSTKEQMVSGDTDQEEDVFVRSFDLGLGEYLTREVSIGPTGGNDAQAAHYDGMSSDGNEVFFSTEEPLVAGDTDEAEDSTSAI